MQIIKTKKLPIYIWATEVEDGAMQQALHLAEHPFAEHHICLLPDVHEGFGMPIGAVLAPAIPPEETRATIQNTRIWK
jgi:tRNA-splicing ligase RtcB